MVTKKEKYLLRQILDTYIYQYLMANSCQRLDGVSKAQNHFKISQKIVGYITTDINMERNNQLISLVHDYLADVLTSKMDEIIGFPIYTPLYGSDYVVLSDRFFDTIIEHVDKLEVLVKTNINKHV